LEKPLTTDNTKNSEQPEKTDPTNLFVKEYWTGDSRDGSMTNGDGYHFFQMKADGNILEAYEVYETDGGEVIATPLPEMINVGWLSDLGFEDFADLETVEEREFKHVKKLTHSK
jgi:hypothetical protein